MRPILALMILALLAACGADGAPEAPGSSPGVKFKGEISGGIVVGGDS